MSPRITRSAWSGGLVCTLADSIAGCAVHTTLDAGIGYTSIDITVNYLRPVTVDSGTLVAVGRVTKPGRRVALAAAEIHDGAGQLVATASSNCLVFPLWTTGRPRPQATLNHGPL